MRDTADRRPRVTLTTSRPVRLGALVVLAVWALHQTFWNLLGHNVHGDESVYVRAGWAYLHGDFSANREHPPTAKYLFGAAQVLFGQGVLGPRIVVGVLVVAVGVTLFWWLRREVGFWTGVLVAAMWLLTRATSWAPGWTGTPCSTR